MKSIRLGVVLFLCFHSTGVAQQKWPTLQEAISEADRLDPGWRLADLIDKQRRIKDEENSASVIAGISYDLARVWQIPDQTAKRQPNPPEPTTLEDLWRDCRALAKQPEHKASERFLRLLSEAEAKFAPLAARARELERYKSGRSPVRLEFNVLSTDRSHEKRVRDVAQLLLLDGYIRAVHGDIDGALQSARAILGAGRSLTDEISLVSHLHRFGIAAEATNLIVFALCHGDGSEPALAATQAALPNEADPSSLLMMLRGERAEMFDLCDKIAAGKIDAGELDGENRQGKKPDGIEKPLYRQQQAIVLHMLTNAVESAKKPTWQQAVFWDDWAFEVADYTRKAEGITGMLPAANTAFPAYVRARSLLGASETIVGFERLRMKTNRWPRPGDSLLPAFPTGLPADPLTGAPITWKATEHELQVYSLWFDGKDDGPKLENDRSYLRYDIDVGYCVRKENKSPSQ